MMGKLPENWEEIVFTDIFDISGGTQPPKSQFIDFEKAGYVRLLQIRDFGKKPIPVYIPDKKNLKKCTYDDILIARYGASIGRIVSGQEGAYNVALAKVIIPEIIPNRFVNWLLKSYIFQTKIISFQRTAQSGFNKNDLGGLTIPLPPLPEQHRIVSQLDRLFSHLDKLKSRLEKVPALMKNFRQAVLTQAVTGKLTEEWVKTQKLIPISETLKSIDEIPKPSRYKSRNTSLISGKYAISVGKPELEIPKGYQWVELVSVAKLETGHTPSKKFPEYWDGNINWIGIKDARVHHGSVVLKTEQQTTDLGIENSAARILPQGTVCMSRTASVGYVVVMGKEMATSQDFVNWVCSEAVNPFWLQILLMAEKASILSFGKGTTHTTVYFPEVISFYVALPPKEEQTQIVHRVEQLFAKADAIESRYTQLKAQIAQLPQALLAKAFRGELSEQLPTDGHAADLLKEIAALRAEATPTKRRRKK